MQERYHELGLLRALGARPGQITRVILTEAAAITALGGLFGLGFGISLVLIFARTFGFYFELIGVPFMGPPIWVTALAASFAVAFSAILGVAGAFVPGMAGAPPGALRAHQGGGGALTLHAAGLGKTYGEGAVAVSHAELKLENGEFVSIVGRSGGKVATLLAMIGALTRPTTGTVLLDEQDIWALPETGLADLRCRAFGFVFQLPPSLLPNLQAIDNVALPALLGRTLDAADAYAGGRALLDRTELRRRADAYPAELSGGEQRRVAIARALINQPRFLLADEPTGDLDEDTENDVIEMLERLRAETPFGLVLVTHNLALAKRADRCCVMERGVLGAIDLPAPVLAPAVPTRRFASLPPANDGDRRKTRMTRRGLGATCGPLPDGLWLRGWRSLS